MKSISAETAAVKSKQSPGVGLKRDIVRFCMKNGADLVGFASPGRWDEFGEVPSAYRPRAVWPKVQTVIVIGMQMPLPIVETTPSTQHMELYRTVNRALDRLAYDLARFLNRRGHASIFFSRDGYGSLKALKDKPVAAFSHVMAAKYAGLGTIGLSHCLLTPAFGPRVRLVSVFTEAKIPPDSLIEGELCIKCGLCVRCCPRNALSMREDRVIGDYDKQACLAMAEELTAGRRYPCGVCIKVCPVGEDRVLYGAKGSHSKYTREKDRLRADPGNPEYRDWEHIRKHG
jgi:epoxyqueuosine reductase QueG